LLAAALAAEMLSTHQELAAAVAARAGIELGLYLLVHLLP
jgi:hypothetical protein